MVEKVNNNPQPATSAMDRAAGQPPPPNKFKSPTAVPIKDAGPAFEVDENGGVHHDMEIFGNPAHFMPLLHGRRPTGPAPQRQPPRVIEGAWKPPVAKPATPPSARPAGVEADNFQI